jgi:hypothetical protein
MHPLVVAAGDSPSRTQSEVLLALVLSIACHALPEYVLGILLGASTGRLQLRACVRFHSRPLSLLMCVIGFILDGTSSLDFWITSVLRPRGTIVQDLRKIL